MLRAFRAFDPEGRGFIEAETLRTLLSGRGEVMTEEELNRMMVLAADEQGRVWYEDYAQKLANDGRTI
ncbi:Dynein regulatory complex protein 8 [Pleodorina starrii]|uniref:Dynein regulatory complex protein 8 n=1 Tax=Pleodorina starrii TaxID=330485 RepID=A0A9W6EX96_9CHLO|nr:Dynein regulatory complex protein 8 [Pleodorina starrii]GLC48045.1 Dynein regulatory complex protein 8 [Pleodorina starrii]GLC53107.1 Dynein regulatory complex protein 8 [Pleodorina starrii]GLC69260.1 Dynein regulatory complex protein 8 [Pleodorina starrii]